jgi:TRAP-type C4-dicarboxylate transport system substrate-binding protein
VVKALLLIACLASTEAHADRTVLRIATAAPDGTAWARLFRTMGRELESESKGEVTAKWYFGGVAGDEQEMLARMKRGQLDAVMSGGMMCIALSPSLRVLRLLGLFQSREESAYVMGRLRPTIDAEFLKNGFVNVGEAGLGSDLVFSRKPISTMDDLKQARLWHWDLDTTLHQQLEAIGVPVKPMSLEAAGRAFEEKQVDGFIAVATAALAFQWSARSSYLTELPMAFLSGCMVVSQRAFDSLSLTGKQAVRTAAARFGARLEDLGRSQDQALLGGLFAKQGVKTVPVTASMRAAFFEAARASRERLGATLVPAELMTQVQAWLADYRAEHAAH